MTASIADRRAVILYFSYFFLTSTAFPDSVLLYPSWPGAHSLRLPYLPYTSRHTIYHGKSALSLLLCPPAPAGLQHPAGSTRPKADFPPVPASGTPGGRFAVPPSCSWKIPRSSWTRWYSPAAASSFHHRLPYRRCHLRGA